MSRILNSSWKTTGYFDISSHFFFSTYPFFSLDLASANLKFLLVKNVDRMEIDESMDT